MIRRAWLLAVPAAVALGTLAGAGVRAGAQHVHSPAGATPAAKTPAVTTPAVKAPTTVTTTPAPAAGTPRRVSEEEIHANNGVPRGWRFAVEPGDAARGRQMFVDLECFKCHEVKNEKFPVPEDGKYTGPPLTGMGEMHPAEYLAESILFPNAVIVDEPGTTGPDGRSVMPSYTDSLTVTQWLDLVAYLKSLTEGGEHPAGHRVERVATAGDYRIRLVYAGGGHDAHAGHGMTGGHARQASPLGVMTPPKHPKGHLMAFITERDTGDAVPYLPVIATLQGPGATRRTVTLRPMMSGDGFHYGADVVLAERAEKLTLVIGPTNMRVAPSAKGRFTKPVTAVFDWRGAAK